MCRCKNFFKRSVVLTQKKPYICNNLNKCDVRIVIDMSGIKRKGARCQACRYAACLDAGMFHSGADLRDNLRNNTFGATFEKTFGRHQDNVGIAWR